MRVGRVVAVDSIPEAWRPAWKLTIDFGDRIGVKRSSAQITNYERSELEGTLVVGVVNFCRSGSARSSPSAWWSGQSTTSSASSCLRPDREAALGDRIA